MKRAIVTGANGFIGSWLVKKLIAHGVEVWAVVRNLTKIQSISDAHIMHCDLEEIAHLPEIIVERGFDVFYHLAWQGSAGDSRGDFQLQMNNVLWNVQALYAAKQLACNRFVNAGSIMEKEVGYVTFAQDTMPSPAYIYGAGKLAAHMICKPIANSIGIPLIWAMITNVYGEGEVSPRFVNTTVRKILNQEPLQFTTATQNYDFIHIEDAVHALYLLGKYGKGNRSYLIGSGNAKPLREFIIEMQQALAPNAVLAFGNVPFTGVNMPLADFSTESIQEDTGFVANITFAQGTRRTLEWIKEES